VISSTSVSPTYCFVYYYTKLLYGIVVVDEAVVDKTAVDETVVDEIT
jgi:hypothetical protein